jgi:addiction module RelB/DinJ family antitoxin
MNTAVINIKTQPIIKEKAQKVAKELGFSLSSLVTAYLKQLIETKTVNFTVRDEIPSKYFIDSMKQSEADIKAGRVLSFKDGNAALSYLKEEIAHERHKRDKND